jgi:outer membrane protein assembly factor BamB
MRDGTLAAFSLATGSVAWTVRTESAVPPLCARDVVLVMGGDVVEARSPEDGGVRWRTPLASAPAAPGAVIGTRLVLGLESGDLVAFDVDSGRTEWSRNIGARASAEPAGDEARLLVGLADGQIVAVHPASGEPLWSFRTAGAVTGLALDGDRAYAGSRDNAFYSLSAAAGRLSWRWRTGGDIVGKPAFDRDRIYVASLDNLLRALDRGNGSQQWKRALRSRPLGGPSVVGEAVMVPGIAPEIRTNWTRDGRPVDRVAIEAELATPFTVLERAWPKPGGLAVVTEAGQLVLFVERIDPELQPFRMPVGVEVPLTAPSDLP